MTRILDKRSRRKRKCKPRDKIGGLCYLQRFKFYHNLKQVTHMTSYSHDILSSWKLSTMNTN